MVSGLVLKPKTTNERNTMTRPKRNDETIQVTKQDLMRMLTEDDAMKSLLQTLLQEVLEAEMDEALRAGKNERTSGRLGYRSGHYPRTLVTRVGKLELRVPQDRQGRFSTELFARYQRSEKALVAALMQMYVQGVSTRRVKTITEELCGHEFSASAISELNVKMDEELRRFMSRRLEEPYPYIILDARYERVRENGVGQSRAVLITLGIGWDGRRHVLAVELAGRESASSWKAHLLRLKERGLHGVQLAVSDDHAGLKRAIMEALPEAYWQRCYVHFLRNALDYLPRKQADDCLVELRWITIVTTRRKPAAIWPRGSPAGRTNTRNYARGSRRTSTRPSPSTAYRGRTTNTSSRPICSNGSTRRSSAAPCWCASSPTRPAAYGSSKPSPSRPTKSGSTKTATSTWTCSGNISNARLSPKPPERREADRLPATLRSIHERVARWQIQLFQQFAQLCHCHSRFPRAAL